VIVSNEIRDREGIACQTRTIDCPTCSSSLSFDIIYYVRADSWPELVDSLMWGEIDDNTCARCRKTVPILSPLIYEIPQRNLLVFVTHGSDDGGAIAAFHQWMEVSSMLLPENCIEQAKRRPFTIVYGWQGLLALLYAFEDYEIPGASPPFPHETDEAVYFGSLDGFKYGKLFFYYPSQLAIKDLARALLRFSEINAEGDKAQWMLSIFTRVVEIIGAHHPWLVHELGRLALVCGSVKEAQTSLKRAVDLQHCWLAVTASFADATPIRREDGPTQSETLPHTTPASVLGDVLTHRHTVSAVKPSTVDYGLWHFPQTSRVNVPETYTPQSILSAHGFVLGELEHAIPNAVCNCGDSSLLSYYSLVKYVVMLIEHFDSEAGSFWEEYLKARWTRHGIALNQIASNVNNEILELETLEAANPKKGLVGLLKGPQTVIEFWQRELDYLAEKT